MRNPVHCIASGMSTATTHLLAGYPDGGFLAIVLLLLNAATEAHLKLHLWATDLPWVAISQPDVRQLSLVALRQRLQLKSISDI